MVLLPPVCRMLKLRVHSGILPKYLTNHALQKKNKKTPSCRHGLWGLDHTRLKYICRDTEKVPTPREVCKFRLH